MGGIVITEEMAQLILELAQKIEQQSSSVVVKSSTRDDKTSTYRKKLRATTKQ